MNTLLLDNGTLRCEVRPDLGGCIAGLWLGDLPVLRSTPGDGLHNVRLSGCFPLVPFSNRIGHAVLAWQGTGHPLVHNLVQEPHAIHGVGWQRPWEVLEHAPDFLMLAHEHRAQSLWPFAYDASQTLRLQSHRLEMTLSITNQSGRPAPVGLGWHPYFVKRADSHIRFHARGRWEMGPDKLPTAHQVTGGLARPCAGLDVDHCFDGWDGQAWLEDEAVRVHLSAPLHHLVVFTTPERDFIAIEPVSHVNNALNLHAQGGDAEQLGVRVLAPGESYSVAMEMAITPAG